jgi:hypothetical protein
MYGDFPCLEAPRFADFHIEIEKDSRSWFGRGSTARFCFDGKPFFTPLPSYQAFAMLEWGLNWCIAAHSQHYLIFHAAVIEREGLAAILPAPPGSGKSTLCAALVNRGWRLLSDELALYDIHSGRVFGMARPINLKNRSITIIQDFAPSAVMTAAVPNTSKGTVALMRPPTESVLRAVEGARPAWVISPAYQEGARPCLESQDKAQAFLLLAEQSFNYEIQGLPGFQALGRMIDQCHCHRFVYSRLDDAVEVFAELSAESPAP